jgi:hypothetical protein
MDHSNFIAAHMLANNANFYGDAHAEDAFYETFGKDHLHFLKAAWLRIFGIAITAKIRLVPPAVTVAQRT